MASVAFDQIVTGRQEQAPRLLVYSPPKIGKTGFAAGIPGVLFLAAESGTQEYDVARVPVIPSCTGRGPTHPCGWKQTLGWLDLLATQPHDYRAVAIDTLDWLEGVLFAHLIATDTKARTTIVEAHGGYGKAYKIAVEHWRTLAAKLDVLSLQRGLTVVLLAHSTIEKFSDPVTQDYDQHRLKLHKHGADFWSEWVDAILFANFEMLHDQAADAWASSGRRVLHTSPPSDFAYVAGNRYGLPPRLDLAYPSLAQALAHSTPAALAAELETVLGTLPGTFTYNGDPKTPDDIRRGFRAALDRRSMRLVIDTARLIGQQQTPAPASKKP